MPQSGADVPDDMEARLVVLGTEHPYSKDADNKAQAAAAAILQSRGNAPRLFQNTLVFLAVDQARLQDLDEAVRRYLAWTSILDEKNELNLDPHQVRQAETQQKAADGAVAARLPEAYQWLLVAGADDAAGASAVAGLSPVRAGQPRRPREQEAAQSEELLVPALAGTRLRMELDKVPAVARRPRRRSGSSPRTSRATSTCRGCAIRRSWSPPFRTASACSCGRRSRFAYADSYDEAPGATGDCGAASASM